MAKRRHVADSEDENISSISNKRARTAESDEGHEPKRDRNTRTIRVDSPTGFELSNADAASFVKQEIDEDEFERRYGEKMHADFERQQEANVQGGIAESGIIEYVEMHQFMCHKFLKFTFGPKINFIIGHNGSGKSAVMAAIIVALGGKTISTGRGKGLRSFIREGQGIAKVTIHIKNQGEEAFRHHEYGDTIIITRKFTKEGGSTWKISSKNGRVISTKKDEVTAICDHMNIQIDNPLNVLTQDAARQFLSSSGEKEKYKLFLRGTQLARLAEEYEACATNVNVTAKILAVKIDALPDLEAHCELAQARYDEAAKAREQKKKADDLKKELAWSYVAAKEAEMEEAINNVAKETRRLTKITESVDKAQVDFDTASTSVEELETEINAIGKADDLSAQKDELKKQMRANKVRIDEYKTEQGQMTTALQNLDGQIKDLEERIEDQARRMAVDHQAKLAEMQRKIEEAQQVVDTTAQRIRDLDIESKKVSAQADNLNSDVRSKSEEKVDIEQKIADCEGMIYAAKKAETDAFIPYGQNMKEVLERIKSMRWVGDMPLGPLGLYVKAKDPETWGELLRGRLSTYLLSFALTDARDRPQLKKLFMATKNTDTPIIIYQQDMFDYRHGEPPEHLRTVLRELQISDPYVLRILINYARIESQILAKTRREAEDILKGLRGGRAWSLDGFSVHVFPEGGSNSSPIDIGPLKGAMNLLLVERNCVTAIRHISERKERFKSDLRGICQDIEVFHSRSRQMKETIDAFNAQERHFQTAHRAAKVKHADLQHQANEDMPVDVQGLEEAKQIWVDEKASIKTQLEHVSAERNLVNQQQHACQHQLNEVNRAIGQYNERHLALTDKITAAVEVRLKAQNDRNYYKGKLEEERKKVEEAEQVAEVVQEEYKSWTDKAAKYCEQVFNPRKTAEVKRNLDSVEKALKEREKKFGASVEEMEEQLNKAKDRLRNVRKELKLMLMLNAALKSSLDYRGQRWGEFCALCALHCKIAFQKHLCNRGYYGGISFKHSEETLKLSVETDDQHQTQGAKRKDAKLLSGGEKSFSTICLLLALWEKIDSPLRCLDEFDVFMDAVNRRISMKMLIAAASMSNNKQYIFITPQDMTNVVVNDGVKVHRMSDPERGEVS